ncbi:hypothetical protein B0T21DRAFT_346710 [Apiosordaria backusii]|uniref:Uncharacterized protein n=1 Tax=Apiosordaria backusii TaxID=314023 RepID=A0AA40EIQ7_9PEZI|nr:hypothetical protein B0T21DRAFT_346710 [Apiosordaria backusii]
MNREFDNGDGLADEADTQPARKAATAAISMPPRQMRTLVNFPSEILRLIFDCGILSFDDYKKVSVVCKLFHTILKEYLFRTLALGVDEVGSGYEWMMDLAGSNREFTRGITRAVLHNYWIDRFSATSLDYRTSRIKGWNKVVNPWQALHVLSNMPDLSALLVDGEDDVRDRYRTVPIASFPGSDCDLPIISSVQTLTIDPDAGSSSFSTEFYGLAIRSCPNITTLRINCQPFDPWMETSFWQGMDLALKEASVLNSLKSLELFRFGYFCRSGRNEMQRWASGWSPHDIRAVHSYFPNITKLSIYGNLNIIWIFEGQESESDFEQMDGDTIVEQRPCTIEEFTPVLAAFDNLEQLVITDEQMLEGDLGDLVEFGQREMETSSPADLSHVELPRWRRDTSRLSNPEHRLERAHELFTSCSEHLSRISFVCKENGVEFARGHGPADKPVITRSFHNKYFGILTGAQFMLYDVADMEPKWWM